jgi:hypothetical protein
VELINQVRTDRRSNSIQCRRVFDVRTVHHPQLDSLSPVPCPLQKSSTNANHTGNEKERDGPRLPRVRKSKRKQREPVDPRTQRGSRVERPDIIEPVGQSSVVAESVTPCFPRPFNEFRSQRRRNRC